MPTLSTPKQTPHDGVATSLPRRRMPRGLPRGLPPFLLLFLLLCQPFPVMQAQGAAIPPPVTVPLSRATVPPSDTTFSSETARSTETALSLATLWETAHPPAHLVQTLLEATQKAWTASPQESEEATGVAQQKTVLQERLTQLQAFLETTERLQILERTGANWPAEEEALKKAMAQAERRPAPTAPDQPTPEAFKRIKNALEEARQAVDTRAAQALERQQILGQIPEKKRQAETQMQQAEERYQTLHALAGKAEGHHKRMLTLQADNARIHKALARLQQARWDAEQAIAMATVAFQDRQLEMAQLHYRYQQKAFALYQAALNSHQAEAVVIRQEELSRKEQAAQEATKPEQRFLAHWDAENARLKKNIADLDTLHTRLVSAISEQEKQWQREKDEMERVEGLIQQFGTRGLAAEILKETFGRLAHRRRTLLRPLYPAYMKQVTLLQTRLFAITTALAERGEPWEKAMGEIRGAVRPGQRSTFEMQARQQRDSGRLLLSEEKRRLFDIQSGGERLKRLILERTELLNRMEALFFSRVFWIQDAPPLGLEMLQQLFSELIAVSRPDSLLNRWRHMLASEVTAQWLDALRSPTTLVSGFILLFLLPFLLIRTRALLRQHVRASNQRMLTHQKPVRFQVGPLLAGILAPALGPLYLWVAATLVGHVLILPAAMTTVLHQGLILLALFWFLWFLNRQIFSPGGFAEALFRLPPDVTRNLLRSVAIGLLAYLVFLPLWTIFREPPFQYEALPRLGYTLFELAAAYALYRLIRHDSPLPRHLFALGEPASNTADASTPSPPPLSLRKGFIRKHWSMIRRILVLFMTTVLVLDVAGYRFGATHLAYNGMRTLVTVLLFMGLYRALAPAVEEVIRRRRRLPTVLAPGARGTQTRSQIAQQINGSLRMLFILAGLFLLSSYWGINEQAFQALKGVTLYSTTDNGQITWVTLADVFGFLCCVFAVGWTLKYLPRMYELLLFPRLSLDAGARYATLTISRYLVFILGLLLALNYLHLDIAKLGWLVAAISVGMGFGLQEIVANFVSGIILLLERPIRVGDMITVGDITGDVTRINIRATTVLNLDHQELLIPNRDLITREVTNWTLANTVIRVVIPIGVAYGSDIDLVRRILLDLAQQQTEILKNPAPAALFLKHGESSLDFELRIYLPNPSLRLVMTDRLNTLINRAFAEHALEIPFPQRDVYIRSGGAVGTMEV